MPVRRTNSRQDSDDENELDNSVVPKPRRKSARLVVKRDQQQISQQTAINPVFPKMPSNADYLPYGIDPLFNQPWSPSSGKRNRWQMQFFKELFRNATKQIGQICNVTTRKMYAFTLECRFRSKKTIYRLDGTYLGFERCRSILRLPLRRDGNGVPEEPKFLYRSKSATSKSSQLHDVMLIPVDVDSVNISKEENNARRAPQWIRDLPFHPWIISAESTDSPPRRYLRFAHLTTGVELGTIHLSDSTFYRDIGTYGDNNCIYAESSLEKEGLNSKDSSSKDPNIVMLFWKLVSFQYVGGFRVSESVFGSGLQSTSLLDDMLAVCSQNDTIRVYDLKPFFVEAAKHDVEIGDEWDFKLYPHSTSESTQRVVGARYGATNCGMPLTYCFKERPPILYEVKSDQQYFLFGLQRHLCLLADGKRKQFVWRNTRSNSIVEGEDLIVVDETNKQEISASGIHHLASTPEKMAVWNGTEVRVVEMHRGSSNEPFKMRAVYVVRPPSTGWTCAKLEYSFTFDILMLLFRSVVSQSPAELHFIDAADGSLLAVLPLPNAVDEEDAEEFELDEVGLTYSYKLKDKFQMDYYTFRTDFNSKSKTFPIRTMDL